MRALSTIRKRANENGYYVRQADVDGKLAYILLDQNMNVRFATASQAVMQDAVYSL